MIVTDFGEADQPAAMPSARTLERFVANAVDAIPLHGDLSVLITTDEGLRKLNRRYRGKNKPTDVLSFPAGPDASGKTSIAGDLAISIDMATRQAAALEHSLATELKVLILHGMLHLAGLDHEKDRGEMAAREVQLRRTLRLPGGLIERTQSIPEAVRKPASPRRSAPSVKNKRQIKKPSAKVARS